MVFAAGAIPNSSNNCDLQVNQQTSTLAAGLNSTKAVNLAVASSNFQVASSASSYEFASIFNIWSFNTACQVTSWKSVNVVFTVGQALIVVSENPGLTEVFNVTVQHQTIHASSTTSQCCWSGYDFYEHQSGGGLYPIYQSVGDWNVPDVSQPSAGFCSAQCAFSVWVGLSPQPFNSTSYFVQAGTWSNVTCSTSCSYQYFGWYEFSPAGGVKCLYVAPGDSISTNVYNQAGGGGSNALYNIQVDDNSLLTSCTVSSYFFSHGTPYYAQFIGERPWTGQALAHLAKFTTTTMKGYIYYNSNVPTIYDPYSKGYYQLWNMVNSGTTNINVSSVSSSGTFTLTWASSAGT